MTQEELLEIIKRKPGIVPKELANESGLSLGAVFNQLGALRKHRLIERVRAGHTIKLYPVGAMI